MTHGLPHTMAILHTMAGDVVQDQKVEPPVHDAIAEPAFYGDAAHKAMYDANSCRALLWSIHRRLEAAKFTVDCGMGLVLDEIERAAVALDSARYFDPDLDHNH